MIRVLVVLDRLRATLVVLLPGYLVAVSSSVHGADAELLLMVDTSRSVSNAEYAQMIDGIAQGFESAGFVDAIEAGTTGSLAVSLVFYTQRNRQEVAVDWMEITDADSAVAFAAAIRAAASPRPLSQPRTGIAGAIDMGASHFLNESETQAMLFVGDGIDNHAQRPGGITREEAVQAARDAALQSGVDVMSALTVGAPGAVDTYFEENVVGGAVGGTPGAVTNVADFANFANVIQPNLNQFVGGIIPEPSWVMLMLGALPVLGRRRRAAMAWSP